MLKSYVKSALRAIRRHKAFAALNIFGLAVGMAACILILQYVSFESGYDEVSQAESIYRVRNNYVRFGGLIYDSAGTFPGVGPSLRKSHPDVLEFARVYDYSDDYEPLLTRLDGVAQPATFREKRVLFVDNPFLELFDVSFLSGNPSSALSDPASIVLTRSAADRYFGGADPVGQFLQFHSGQEESLLRVTGVIQNAPPDTHLPFDVLVSYSTLFSTEEGQDYFDARWAGEAKYHTYVRLRDGANPDAIRASLPAMVDFYKPDYMETNDAGERLRTNEFFVDPLPDIHATSTLQNDIATNGNGRSVWILALVAALILIIAWVNYVNLSTARALERAREVGIRKVVGSTRGQLLQQFMFEVILFNAGAFCVALVLAMTAAPLISEIVGRDIPSIWTQSSIWGILLGALVLGTLAAGLSPSLFLSSFSPARTLKGTTTSGMSNGFQRKFLVVLQFAIAFVLITGTLTIFRQLEFMRSRDLGFSQEQILVVPRPAVLPPNGTDAIQTVSSFKTDVLTLTDVGAVSGSDAVPGQMILRGLAMSRFSDPDRNVVSVEGVSVDYSFFSTYEMEFAAGRAFSPDFSDSTAVIYNETGLRTMGFESPQSALGQEVEFLGARHPIVGVVKDYHHDSLHRAVDPMFFILGQPGTDPFFSVKIQSPNIQVAVGRIEEVYRTHFPGNPFEYEFLDQSFNAQYAAEQAFGLLFRVFSFLAILIACLGLYGMSTFVTTRRTREIGIRKVNGATARNILVLLSGEFMKPVLLGFLVAVPVSTIVLQNWLATFAFRVNLAADLYAMAGGAVLVIAVVSVMQASLKASRMRPVEALTSD